MSGCHGITVNDSINLMDMAFRETILDDAAERPRLLALDEVTLILALFGTGDLRVVEVLLEHDLRVIVDLSGLDVEVLPVLRFMTVIESVLIRVLLTRVTAIEGEVGEVLRGHGDCAGR
jgi:hypothetical protein